MRKWNLHFLESKAAMPKLFYCKLRKLVPLYRLPIPIFLSVYRYFYRIWYCIGCGSRARTGGNEMILKQHGERGSGIQIINTRYVMKFFDGHKGNSNQRLIT